jgi:Tfp pilus assembly protein PilX
MLMNLARKALRRAADERGFSMVAVMLVMMVSGLFLAGAFAAANGEVPVTRDSQDRKQALGAAEAGLEYYAYHLATDNDYWAKCTNVPAPNTTEPSPVVQRWSGTGTDTRANKWRKIPGSSADYAIELLPAGTASACVPAPGDTQASMINPDGTFRIRATGRSNGTKRSLVGTFRRKTFLDFLYFTDLETADPTTYANSQLGDYAAQSCMTPRSNRPWWCTEIQFGPSDAIRGPLHTNDDSIMVCGSPTFGTDSLDAIEVVADRFTWKTADGCASASPVFNGPTGTGAAYTMPTTNDELKTLPLAGYKFTGETTIRLKGDETPAKISVKNANVNGGAWTDKPFPPNGVIYVQSGGWCPANPPITATYTGQQNCANVYVSGTYNQSLTINAENDIIIKPPAGSSNGDVIGANDAVLGLIANNFVRVAHEVTRGWRDGYNACTNVTPTMQNVTIEAAILSLQHSFIVDNYACGAELGTLKVKGAIAQKFRGPVGTTADTGFAKDYNYDKRLRYRSPPYFLQPEVASWQRVRLSEQVPAT